jgi:predicted Zn-dependent protease
VGIPRRCVIVHAIAALILISISACTAPNIPNSPAPTSPKTPNSPKPFYLGPMFLGYDLGDLPVNPTPEQEVTTGARQLAVLRESDQSLDSNAELLDYFRGIAAALLKGHEREAQFPIVIHVSTAPVVNAFALPGGQVLFYSRIILLADNESEFVSILAHEISHELNRDFVAWWRAYKAERQVYGKGGVLEDSRGEEARADERGARLMYEAGWNPHGMVANLRHLYFLGVRQRRGAPTFYSTHPRDIERIKALEAFIETFPPKPGLIKDSPRFQELKKRL